MIKYLPRQLKSNGKITVVYHAKKLKCGKVIEDTINYSGPVRVFPLRAIYFLLVGPIE